MPFVIVIVVAFAFVGSAFYFLQNDSAPTTDATETVVQEPQANTPNTVPAPVPTTAEAPKELVITDVTNTAADPANLFSAKATYLTPARTSHEIEVTLTVTDGVVTAADVIYDAGEGFSNPNQERFDKAYEAEVIGKELANISLSRVGGASLTTQAFNDAVKQILADSQS